MSSNVRFSLDDLTTGALKRLVQQLLAASDGEEREILKQLEDDSQMKESNDLADLNEEKRGSPSKIKVEDDTPKKAKV